ncbi:3-deoxy-D-manno-octulosonic acid transferase [Fluviispira sanaruensis]|uniref:3-deoxy-D-manno-octulosonic acid transferase n=1 Tax=Fluviispira sanaruensis TaxID=2493639 RepID=A0A4P2VID5_FLUSA|nr:glycosyltransferase N-terminal domain-containing protein [Fluviispira sanaruensis]BBH51604.1 3-deoxy-D-manno-octulosonic acid transferase [Fluviispira sanaruensis]
MYFLYEVTQKIIYFVLNLLAKYIHSRKFKKFCEARTSQYFINKIKDTENNYLEIKENNSKYFPVYWFHVASAGEMEQAIPVARKLNEKMNARFLLTYFSPSAEPFIKNFPALISAFSLPIDSRKNYKLIFSSLPISKIFFVRYDIWPALLHESKNLNIEINLLSASAIKTKNGILGKISNIWNIKFYKNFSNIFAVTKEDVEYFTQFLPLERVHYSGDAKWSRAFERANNCIKRKIEKDFSIFYSYCMAQREVLNKKNIVFGSPHKEEDKIALDCGIIKDKVFLIYVPHDVTEESCKKIIDNFRLMGTNSILYSELISIINNTIKNDDSFILENLYELKNHDIKRQSLFNSNNKDYNIPAHILSGYEVVIFDKIGYLAEIYEISDIAIIGGGFDGQIHNVLEAAAHGVPVLIGNLFVRASEAKELVNRGGAISFQNTNELFQFLIQWVSLEEQGTDSPHPTRILAQSKSKSLELFRSIPDTSEIVLQALFNEP